MSTTDQNNEIQVKELNLYARSRGWEVVETHLDQMSGAKTVRPGLTAVMGSARARRIDVVLVWKLDRFGRSARDLHNNLEELGALGVRFIATSQGIDTDTSNPVSRFLITILGAVAELERDFIKERVAVGMAHAKVKGTRSGKAIGRPRVIANRGKIEEMRAAGKSYGEIAEALKLSKATVYRLAEAG